MARIVGDIVDFHDYVLENWGDPRAADYFLMGSLWNVLAIITVYLYFVMSLGPKLMEKREPFDLNSILIVYNIIQVNYCTYLFIKGSIHIPPHVSIFCEPCSHTRNFQNDTLSKLMHYYFLLKVLDLLDTVFFVLKKNHRQISFLHVYHHLMMVIFMWIATTFVPGGTGIYLGYINCLVHMVMYTYYLLCVIFGTSKVRWLKKQVTRLQIAQFCCNVVIFTFPILQPTCGYPKWTCYMAIIQNIYMLYAFGDFYYKTYVKPEKKIN
ncbi:hypothetical protein Trydic_g13407 [Trypoxylus dichotomus]